MFRVALIGVFILATGSVSFAQENTQAHRRVSGTGFYVSENGHILTNAHVVTGCRSASVADPAHPRNVAQILARDTASDLALLLVSNAPRAVPPFKPTVRIGEAVAVYGFPLAGVLPSTGNFTMGNVTATAGLADDARMLQISAPVQPGNSGGPLMDTTGSIVGVVTAQLKPSFAQNVNFAIKSSVAIAFLERNGVSASSTPQSAAPLPSADLAERAQQFTVFIVCHRQDDEAARRPEQLPSRKPDTVTASHIIGTWCGSDSHYHITRTSMTVTRASDSAQLVFDILKLEARESSLLMQWRLQGRLGGTEFGEFSADGRKMVQLANAKGPRREFRRC